MTTAIKTKQISANKVSSIIVLVLSAFVFICLITTRHLLGAVGEAVSSAILGCFGLSAYGIFASGIVLSALTLAGRKVIIPKFLTVFSLLYITITLFVHLATSGIYMDGATNITYSQYLERCFDFFAYPSFGGIIAGALVYPVAHTSLALAYVFFIVLMLVMIYFAAGSVNAIANQRISYVNGKDLPDAVPAQPAPTNEVVEPVDEPSQALHEALSKLYNRTSKPEQQAEKAPESDAFNTSSGSSERTAYTPTPQNTYNTAPVSTYAEKPQPSQFDTYRSQPITFVGTEITDTEQISRKIREQKNQQNTNKADSPFEQSQPQPQPQVQAPIAPPQFSDGNQAPVQVIPIKPQPTPPVVEKQPAVPPVSVFSNSLEENEQEEETTQNTNDSMVVLNAEEADTTQQLPLDAEPNTLKATKPEQAKPAPTVSFGSKPVITADGRVGMQGVINIDTKPPKPIQKYPAYIAPPLELLKEPLRRVVVSPETYEETARQLEEVLLSFRIEAKVVNIIPGSTVTSYELRLAPGVPVKKVVSLADDIGRPLSAVDKVRIEPQIMGKDLFGVEIPNASSDPVLLRTIIDSNDFYNAKGNLNFCLGMDISGKRIIPDLADMPHLLIAGATGMGKSVLLNSLIVSLMYRYSPEELRFLLVDPKQVEFFVFAKSPHLLINKVITEPEQCISALSWLVDEMERRYTLFKDMGAKNVEQYNKAIDRETTEILPRIALVIDELNDLMTYNKQEIETRIRSLAQKARAAGIHLVFATQRPSVDVLTGTIKANFPCRVALKTTSFADSKTILDQGGADRLVGKGDMLFVSSSTPRPIRLQGCFVSMREVENVVEFIVQKNKAIFNEEAQKRILNATNKNKPFNEDEDLDSLFKDALLYCIEQKSASNSLLQRRYGIGYARAGRLIESFCDRKFISPFDGAKSRKVLITMEEYQALFGDTEGEGDDGE